MAPAGIAYIDGRTMDLATATVPLNDRGFLLGDGVFETLRTSNGRIFRLDRHAARLEAGLRAVNLDADLVGEFRQAVDALVRDGTEAFGGELYVRVMVSTGPMEDFLETGRGVSVTGLCKKFKPYPMQYYSQGVDLVTSRERKDSRSAIATVKTLSFLPYVTARREAHNATAHDALLLNEHGRVTEATTSNVFALHGGTVHAPGEAEGAIPGVTRAAVLELVQDAGFPVVERLDVATLRKADEVWLTNTTGGIVPVRQVDEQRINGGRGELTARLGHALEAAIRGDA
jgi:branched-chain amino acid aminotransferase